MKKYIVLKLSCLLAFGTFYAMDTYFRSCKWTLYTAPTVAPNENKGVGHKNFSVSEWLFERSNDSVQAELGRHYDMIYQGLFPTEREIVDNQIKKGCRKWVDQYFKGWKARIKRDFVVIESILDNHFDPDNLLYDPTVGQGYIDNLVNRQQLTVSR